MNIATLTKFKALNAKIKEMEAEAEALKKEIIAEMNVNEEKRVGQYTITYKAIERSDVDRKALESEYPEIFNEVKKTVVYNKLTVK